MKGNPNIRLNAEQAFQESGPWEQNEGRKQTRLFAECFHRQIKVSLKEGFSVLDVGCALGDALPVWKRYYPKSKLFGCDFSETAVNRSQQLYGGIANFFRADIEEIKGFWDVIYCSNVLEHFQQYLDIAMHLLHCCRILYIMTPYAELRNGKALTFVEGEYHMASFFENTFDVLKKTGRVCLSTHIVRCSGAWGPTLSNIILKYVKSGFKPIGIPKQIIYSIEKEIGD